MKRTKFNVPIFHTYIEVIYTDDLSKVEDYVCDCNNVTLSRESTGLPDAITITGPDNYITIGFQDIDLYKVLHECNHATFSIISLNGLGDNEEVHCYILEWLFEKVWTFLQSIEKEKIDEQNE